MMIASITVEVLEMEKRRFVFSDGLGDAIRIFVGEEIIDAGNFCWKSRLVGVLGEEGCLKGDAADCCVISEVKLYGLVLRFGRIVMFFIRLVSHSRFGAVSTSD